MFIETGSPTARYAASRGSRRRAFTLTELLIVMGVIILAVTLAIPAIRALTGSRSEQAAQNVLAGVFARARTEAIGLQEPQGVLFLIDPISDRVTCVQVIASPAQVPITGNNNSDVLTVVGPFSLASVTYLDLAPDHDPVTLPAGVRLQMLKEPVQMFTPQSTQQFRSPIVEQFLGFEPLATFFPAAAGNTTPRVGGVILFDGEGRIAVKSYGFKVWDLFNNRQTALGQILFPQGTTPSTVDWPTRATQFSQLVKSQIGLILFDREIFASQGFSDQDGQANENQKETWLAQNATPIFINRYNGTLTRAE
jgi:type II secretory pathway pseudopilin PulG